jgi:hypothetical protein
VKKLLLTPFLFVAITANSFANELHHFSEVKSAVMQGKAIRIITDFSKCSSFNKETVPPIRVGGFTPNKIQVIDSRILTSFTHFTLSDPRFPDRAVFEFVRYVLTEDNNLTLSYQTLDARNYAVLTEKVSFNCKMGTGFKVYD